MQNTHNLLKDKKIDALLITNTTNIFYLTGFKGVSPTEKEALLILRKPKNILITAKLYQAEAKKVASQTLNVKIAAERDEYKSSIKQSLSGIKRLGFESHNLTVAEHKKFNKYTKAKLVPTKDLIEELRVIKSTDEIANIQRAQHITQKAYSQILKTIKVGQTEAEIAEKLIRLMENFGAQAPSFNPIIASGPNSAKPHHITSKRKIKPGDNLLMDFGVKYKNYCADFSRTVFISPASDQQRKIYELVLKSQLAATKKIQPGIKAKTVYEASHKVFKEEKVDNHFIHSLGHGIGLEVHEKPSLSAKSKDKLQPGMVFSVEPGLYFPWGGVRIEDLVTVDRTGAKLIGKTSPFIELSI